MNIIELHESLKGCINETFRVLKDNEIRQYGEYRAKHLALEAWNKFKYDD